MDIGLFRGIFLDLLIPADHQSCGFRGNLLRPAPELILIQEVVTKVELEARRGGKLKIVPIRDQGTAAAGASVHI